MARVAIVTGGASGIGRALAAAAVDRGGTVVLADVDLHGARVAARELTARGPGHADAAEVDVRDAAAVQQLVDRTRHDHGRIDFLFNNAGIGVGGRPDELTLAHWERTIDVNLRGVLHGCHAVWPVMLEQGFGHIVNTASLAGLVAIGGLTPYTMTKHAVVGLSLGLRLDGSRDGIRVSALCPGIIDTPILDRPGPEDLPEAPSVGGIDLREFVSQLGPLYAPERLAQDVMRGMARNDAVIIAPMRARLVWRLWGRSPRAYLAVAELLAQAGERWIENRTGRRFR